MTTGTGTTGPGAPGAGAAGAPEAGSAPPAGTGEPLHSAAAAGHRDAVLDALAGSRLFVLVARLHADTPASLPRSPRSPTRRRRAGGVSRS